MEEDCSTGKLKRAELTEASTSTISKRPRFDVLEESPLLLPSSDSLEKIVVPSASGANPDPSASTTSENGNNYYVFLSFRGPDTRNGFVDHLYHRLNDLGLKFHQNFVFRDDEDLLFGEDIGENLISAIERSKISIPVISENYAASKWCLRELIHIMKCKESRGQIVLPVLYKVKTDDVKHMLGKFGEAFKSNMHRFEEDVKQEGPVALRKAVDLRVFESHGREGKLVNELVEIIMCKQQHNFQPCLPVNLVGVDDRVAEVMTLMDLACPNTRIIGIWGMGGIGKTTLATSIYKKLFDKFQCRCSLKDIRETIKRMGINHVQSLLISDITKSPPPSVGDSDIGIGMIRSSCEKKKVLILLDDVDHRDHVNKLIGGCNFESGSRIIITCRDMAILDSDCKRYELKEMNHEDSMLLFGKYAFEGEQPPSELEALSSDIVATTGGLPLALTVIGSLLKRKDKGIWTDMLRKLRKMPHKDVQEKLKLSYDALDDNEKQMFIDMACFCIGTDKRIATYLWEDLQLYPCSGLARMIELSLIKIDNKNQLRMHDQLRDLGRAIACPTEKKPWQWSRLWDDEAIKFLQRKKANSDIEALCLDENGSNMFMNQRSFEMMPDLKFLHLIRVDFVGNFEDSLYELRWLEWEKCPNSFGMTDVHLEKLLILDLSYGYISHEWRGWSLIKMERLKVLNLSHCIELVRTPNLSAFKSLEMLILKECDNLKEIDPSIGDVKFLTSLNLSNCHNLQELPDSISHLVNLSTLDLSGWNQLQELPDSISHLVNLSTLELRFCREFKGFPESIGSLVKLQHLLLGNMALQSEDRYSEFWECAALIYCFDRIPHSIGKLQSLTELHFTCTKISELPESIGDLKSLKILKIAGCKELSSLPSAISKLSKLEELDAAACDILEGAVPINGLSSLKILRLGKLGRIRNLWEIHEMNDDLSLESFSDLSSRQHLDLTNCDLPASLTILEITSHNRRLPRLSHLSHLKELTFQFC